MLFNSIQTRDLVNFNFTQHLCTALQFCPLRDIYQAIQRISTTWLLSKCSITPYYSHLFCAPPSLLVPAARLQSAGASALQARSFAFYRPLLLLTCCFRLLNSGAGGERLLATAMERSTRGNGPIMLETILLWLVVILSVRWFESVCLSLSDCLRLWFSLSVKLRACIWICLHLIVGVSMSFRFSL